MGWKGKKKEKSILHTYLVPLVHISYWDRLIPCIPPHYELCSAYQSAGPACSAFCELRPYGYVDFDSSSWRIHIFHFIFSLFQFSNIKSVSIWRNARFRGTTPAKIYLVYQVYIFARPPPSAPPCHSTFFPRPHTSTAGNSLDIQNSRQHYRVLELLFTALPRCPATKTERSTGGEPAGTAGATMTKATAGPDAST